MHVRTNANNLVTTTSTAHLPEQKETTTRSTNFDMQIALRDLARVVSQASKRSAALRHPDQGDQPRDTSEC
eukprot:12909312-Prorocentrum_lima.AAC.1